MKRIYQLLLVFALSFSVFGLNVETAKADPLLSALVKQEANYFCGSSARFSGESQANSSNFTSQVRTSKSGSSIILHHGQFKNYGYCHVYSGHMKLADNTKNNVEYIGGKYKSQFQYASFPSKAMTIAMEVINTDKSLEGTGTRRTKEIYSPTEGQRVKVVLHQGSDFSGFSSYDWVIISMYPVF